MKKECESLFVFSGLLRKNVTMSDVKCPTQSHHVGCLSLRCKCIVAGVGFHSDLTGLC